MRALFAANIILAVACVGFGYRTYEAEKASAQAVGIAVGWRTLVGDWQKMALDYKVELDACKNGSNRHALRID